ncbi:MAG: hypothetical protein D6689_06715 [Deltaproteobacteria bacterium]|nr:MAG: hypothetical protein D6689_06715 [Deltaproteobacteria bacterium]
MTPDRDHAAEFRRYRQVLATAYAVVAAAGGALLAASVIYGLFFERTEPRLTGPRLSADNPNPEELIACNRDVARLLDDLGRHTATLMATAGASGDPGGSSPSTESIDRRWETLSRRWRMDYDEVGARCRFSELANQDLGTAYDRMASVYAELPAVRLKYQSLLVRFEDDLAGQLRRMRRALDRSLAALTERAQDSHGRGHHPGRER